MSILIKGMEMPTSCYQCVFLFHPERHGKVYCTAVEPMMDISETLSDERASDCPLVPVPPHGDLIDYDFCMENYELLHDDDGNPVYAVRMRDINNAPTIIPADPAEEDE